MELTENVMLVAGWSYARAYFSLARLLANTTESDAFVRLAYESRLIVSLINGEGRLCTTGTDIVIGGAQSLDDDDKVSFPMRVPSYFAANGGLRQNRPDTVFSAHNLPISYIVSFLVTVFSCHLQIAEDVAESIFMNPVQGLSCASMNSIKWLADDALIDRMTDGVARGVSLSIRRYVLKHLSAQRDHLCRMLAVSRSELTDILTNGVGADSLHYPHLTLSSHNCSFCWPQCRFFCDHLMDMLRSRAFVTTGAVSGYLVALGFCPFGVGTAQFQAYYGFSIKHANLLIGGKKSHINIYVAPNGNPLASNTELVSRKYYLTLPKSVDYEATERDSGAIHTEPPPTAATKLGTASVSKKTLVRTTTMHSKRRREESAELSTCSIVTNQHQLPRRIDEFCDDEVASRIPAAGVKSNGIGGGSFWGFTRALVARNTDRRSESGLHNTRDVSVGNDVFFGHISLGTFCSPLTGQRFLRAVQNPSSTLSPILAHTTVCETTFFDRYVTRSPKLDLNWVGHAVISPAVSNWLSDGQERDPQATREDLCATLPIHICTMSRLYSARTCFAEPLETQCASKRCTAESHLSILCPPELLTQSALPALRSVTFPSMLVVLRFGLHDAIVKKKKGCLPQSFDAINASKKETSTCVLSGLQLLAGVSYEVSRLKESVREHVLQASSKMAENSTIVGGCTSLMDGKLLSCACAFEPHRDRDRSKRGRRRGRSSSSTSFFMVDSLYQLSLLLFEKHPLYLRVLPHSIPSTEVLTLRTRLLLSLSQDDPLSLFFPTNSTSNLQPKKALSEFFVRLLSEESERNVTSRQKDPESKASFFLAVAFISPLFAHCVALISIHLLLLDASCLQPEGCETILKDRLFTFKTAHKRVCDSTTNTCNVCEMLDVTTRYLAGSGGPSTLPLNRSVRSMLLQVMFDQAAMPCSHNVHEYISQTSAVQNITKAKASSGDLNHGLWRELYGTPDGNDCPRNKPLAELFERVYHSANECLSTLFSPETNCDDAPRNTLNATDATDERSAVKSSAANYFVALRTIRKWIYLRTARDHSAVKLSLLSGVERIAVEALAGTYADGTLKRLRDDMLFSSQTQNVKDAHTPTEGLLDGVSGDVQKLLSLVDEGECDRLLGLPHVAHLVCARTEEIVSEVLNAERDTQRQFLENITMAFSECCRAIVKPQEGDKPDTEHQDDAARMISTFETTSRVLCERYLSALTSNNDVLAIPRCNLLLARARKLYEETLHRISEVVTSERIERIVSIVNCPSPPTSPRLKSPTYTHTYAHLLDIIGDSSPCVVSEQIAVGIITLEIPYEGMFTTIVRRDDTSTPRSQAPASLEEHIFALRALSRSKSAFSVTSLEEDKRYLERALDSCENRFQQLKARKALGALHPEGFDSEEDQISSTTSCVGEEVLELLRRYCCSLDSALCIFSKAALSSVQAYLNKRLSSKDRWEDAQGVRSKRLAHDHHLKASICSLLNRQKEQRCMLSLLRSDEIERVIQKQRQTVALPLDISSHATALTLTLTPAQSPNEEGRLVVASKRKEGLYSTSLLLVAYDTARLMKRQLCEICALLLELRELSNTHS